MKIWLTAALVASFALAASAEKTFRIVNRDKKVDGKTYEEWAAEFWKWLFLLPRRKHPAFDVTGKDCARGQDGAVYFIPGAYSADYTTSEGIKVVDREDCTFPYGKYIFFPLFTSECSNVETDSVWDLKSEQRSYCPTKFIDGTMNSANHEDWPLFLEIDGKKVKNLEDYRAKSPKFTFEFSRKAKKKENMLWICCKGYPSSKDCEDATTKFNCDNMKAVADGYWIMLKPLSRGKHTIHFQAYSVETGGTCDGELRWGMDVTIGLTIE